MVMKNPFEYEIPTEDYNGRFAGINQYDNPLEITENQLTSCKNMSLSKTGLIGKLSTRLGTDAIGNDLGSLPILNMISFSSYLLAVEGTTLHKWSGTGNFSAVYSSLTSNTDCNLLVMPGKDGTSADDTGTAESGTSISLTDTNKSWTINEYVGYWVVITAGTGVGQVKLIQSNTDDTLTISGTFETTPDSTSVYGVFEVTDNLYVLNSTDNALRTWDNTNYESVSGFKNSKVSAYYNNMYFVFDTTDTKKLYISEPLVPMYVAPDSTYSYKSAGIAIAGLANQVCIFTESGIHGILGYSPNALTFVSRDATTVLVSRKSLININNSLLVFLGRQGNRYGLYQFDGYSSKLVAKELLDEFDNINRAYADRAVAYYYNNIIRFAYPYGDATYNNREIIIDTINGFYTINTGLNINCYAEYEVSNTPELFYGEASNDGLVYKMETGTNDNGGAISFEVITKDYAFPPYKDRDKTQKFLHVYYKASGAYDIVISYSFDGGSNWNTLGTMTTSDTNFSTWRKGFPQPDKGNIVRLKFTNATLDNSFTILGWKFYGEVEGER